MQALIHCRFHLPPGRMPEISQLILELTSGDDAQAEESIRQIIHLKEDAIPSLLVLRDSSNPDERWWAYCALGQMPEAESSWFFPGLHDEVPEVREGAVMGLSGHPHPEAVEELIDALHDSDKMVVVLAGAALTAIGGDAVPPLISVMENGSAEAGIQAARSLAEIRDPRAIPAFMAALENGTELVKFWAEQGLQNLGSEMLYFNTQ